MRAAECKCEEGIVYGFVYDVAKCSKCHFIWLENKEAKLELNRVLIKFGLIEEYDWWTLDAWEYKD